MASRARCFGALSSIGPSGPCTRSGPRIEKSIDAPGIYASGRANFERPLLERERPTSALSCSAVSARLCADARAPVLDREADLLERLAGAVDRGDAVVGAARA